MNNYVSPKAEFVEFKGVSIALGGSPECDEDGLCIEGFTCYNCPNSYGQVCQGQQYGGGCN